MNWKFWSYWTSLSNRLSMKSRIGLGMAASRLIFLPVITLSIYYIHNMVTSATRIATVEVASARLADQIIQGIEEIRKSEVDYLMLKDSTHLTEIDEKTKALNTLIDDGLSIDFSEKASFANLKTQVGKYRQSIQSIAQTIVPVSEVTGNNRFQDVVNSYQKLVNSMLEAAKQSRSIEEVNRSIVEISNPKLSFDRYASQSLIESDPKRFEQLHEQGERLHALALQISVSRWKKVEIERLRIEMLGHRATTLITITLVLTLVISFIVTWFLPRRVLRPLRQVTQALRTASSGNYDVFLHLSAKDELGDLVNEFHNLIEHMRDQKNGHGNGNIKGNSPMASEASSAQEAPSNQKMFQSRLIDSHIPTPAGPILKNAPSTPKTSRTYIS